MFSLRIQDFWFLLFGHRFSWVDSRYVILTKINWKIPASDSIKTCCLFNKFVLKCPRSGLWQLIRSVLWAKFFRCLKQPLPTLPLALIIWPTDRLADAGKNRKCWSMACQTICCCRLPIFYLILTRSDVNTFT